MGRVPAVRSLLENSRFSVNESCENAKSVLFVPLSKSFVSPVIGSRRKASPRMPEERTSQAEISSFFYRSERAVGLAALNAGLLRQAQGRQTRSTSEGRSGGRGIVRVPSERQLRLRGIGSDRSLFRCRYGKRPVLEPELRAV